MKNFGTFSIHVKSFARHINIVQRSAVRTHFILQIRVIFATSGKFNLGERQWRWNVCNEKPFILLIFHDLFFAGPGAAEERRIFSRFYLILFVRFGCAMAANVATKEVRTTDYGLRRSATVTYSTSILNPFFISFFFPYWVLWSFYFPTHWKWNNSTQFSINIYREKPFLKWNVKESRRKREYNQKIGEWKNWMKKSWAHAFFLFFLLLFVFCSASPARLFIDDSFLNYILFNLIDSQYAWAWNTLSPSSRTYS